MRLLTKRRFALLLAAVLCAIVAFLYPKWQEATRNGGQKPVEPFQMAGNLYYVGANDVTSYLITSPQGHVLIDGGYPGTAKMIMANIAKLGFKITDVKVLLNSHAHYDHVSGMAEIQKASGAQVWISEPDADVVANGGANDRSLGRLWFASYLPILRYPAPRVSHRFNDGAKIRVGPIELTAHITPPHTPGCTSWSFLVRDRDRDLLAVKVCSLSTPFIAKVGSDSAQRKVYTDFQSTFATLRALPADIFLTAHAKDFGRYRKFKARDTASDPAAPFIDRAGYLSYIDSAEARVKRESAKNAQQ